MLGEEWRTKDGYLPTREMLFVNILAVLFLVAGIVVLGGALVVVLVRALFG